MGEEQLKEKHESRLERSEALEGLIKQFDREIKPKIQEHLHSSNTIFQEEGGYDDNVKRESFSELIGALSVFQETVRSISALFEKAQGGHLSILWTSIERAKKQLTKAPDMRYNLDSLAQKFKGEQNIPSDRRYTYEQTKDSILELISVIDGMKGALEFLNGSKE